MVVVDETWNKSAKFLNDGFLTKNFGGHSKSSEMGLNA
jgi:hypothetical protein